MPSLMKRGRILVVGFATLALGATLVVIIPGLRARAARAMTGSGGFTVADRLTAYGSDARLRMEPAFEHAGVAYPPAAVRLVALKRERVIHVFAGPGPNRLTFISSYPILAASGGPGPKTREGDRQVPEGVYRVESLNPNSLYHLALRVGYPSAEDIEAARAEGRDPKTLGDDIMIHGSSVSIGCLAMGDTAIEELFVLAADVGASNVDVIIAPSDPRNGEWTDERAWVQARYSAVRRRVGDVQFPERR
jgi:hypothetical protein